MIKGRRVGTFTAGCFLILFGILFMVRTFIPEINLSFILSLWPLILIFTGGEILVAWCINREDKMRYDFGALFLTGILLLFAFSLAGAEFIIQHSDRIAPYLHAAAGFLPI